jgi:SAM-dependent methyltransferase
MLRKPKWLVMALNIRQNVAARWRLARGNVASDIGATHSRWSTSQSVDYINRVFHDYLSYGALTPANLSGKTVLEIGPGDNLGVALRMYAAGAERVICLDKFFSARNDEQQAAIYRALREHLSPEERVRYDRAIDESDGVTIDERFVRYSYGCAAEDADTLLGIDSVDLVISRAVLWEIFEIERALLALHHLLRPGGLMIHKIACLDWMFRQEGYHPLEFLTIPETIYRWMAKDSGKSNRRTIEYYRTKMAELGYDADFHITRVVGSARRYDLPPGVSRLRAGEHYDNSTLQLIHDIRPRLASPFKTMSDEDLMIEDMFVVARKPVIRDASAQRIARA